MPRARGTMRRSKPHLDEIARFYRDTPKWGAWIDPGNAQDAKALTDRGLVLDSRPVLMAAPLDAIGAPEQRQGRSGDDGRGRRGQRPRLWQPGRRDRLGARRHPRGGHPWLRHPRRRRARVGREHHRRRRRRVRDDGRHAPGPAWQAPRLERPRPSARTRRDNAARPPPPCRPRSSARASTRASATARSARSTSTRSGRSEPQPGARRSQVLPALRATSHRRLPPLDQLPPLRLRRLLQPEAGGGGDPGHDRQRDHPPEARLRPRQGPVDVPRRLRRPRRVGGRGSPQRGAGGARDRHRAHATSSASTRAPRTASS